jgi:hypothetical protein
MAQTTEWDMWEMSDEALRKRADPIVFYRVLEYALIVPQ